MSAKNLGAVGSSINGSTIAGVLLSTSEPSCLSPLWKFSIASSTAARLLAVTVFTTRTGRPSRPCLLISLFAAVSLSATMMLLPSLANFATTSPVSPLELAGLTIFPTCSPLASSLLFSVCFSSGFARCGLAVSLVWANVAAKD